MKNREEKYNHSVPYDPQPEQAGLFDEARAIYRRYADFAAKDKARLEMEESAKPAWLKALHIIGIIAVIIAAIILLYGAFSWPDAPIRQTPNGFAGKTGLPHTREDYELFKLWEKSLLIAFPVAFIVNFAAIFIAKRRKQKK